MIGGWLGERLREPSTHNAVAGLLVVASVVFPQYKFVADCLATLFFGVGFTLPEQGRPRD